MNTEQNANPTLNENPNANDQREFPFYMIMWIILAFFIAIFILINPKFLYLGNLLNILPQIPAKGLMALGMAGIIALGTADLSAGRILGLCAAINMSLVSTIDSVFSNAMWFIPLLLSIAIALVVCAINGLGIMLFKAHGFIVTLGTQFMVYAVTCMYFEGLSEGGPITMFSQNSVYSSLVNGGIPILGNSIPYSFIIFVVITVGLWLLWKFTPLGKNILAIGRGREAVTVSGMSIVLHFIFVFVIAGVLYGLSAFFEAGRIQQVSVQTGIYYEIDAITACLIGGISLVSGRGNILGVAVAAILLQTFSYAMSFIGFNPYLQIFIKGLLLILALAFDIRAYRTKKEKVKMAA